MTYILRNLPPELWTRFKARAAADGWPLRALLLALVTAYVEGRVPLPAPPMDRGPQASD